MFIQSTLCWMDSVNDSELDLVSSLSNRSIRLIQMVITESVSLLEQGSSNLSLEVQSDAEFSSNPDQTHRPVIF